MTKIWVGLFLGLVSFFVFMAIGEGGSLAAAFVSVAAFLFVSQLLLSRGHADAHRKDWRIMLALAAPLMAATFLMVLLERRDVILAQGPIILFAWAGIYSGAALASWRARRAAGRAS